MGGIQRDGMKVDTVDVAVLMVTAFDPLSIDGIVKALTNLGAPSWRPVTDVIVGAIDRLLGQNLIVPVTSPSESPVHETSVRLAPTPAGWHWLPHLLRALPFPSYGSDITYRLKVMGLDLLDDRDREHQIAELAGHWQRVLALWERAQERCPCMQPSVRLWMKRNAALARMEIDWLRSECIQPRSKMSVE